MGDKRTYSEKIVISLGGSLIVPNGGIDTTFLKNFINNNNNIFNILGGVNNGSKEEKEEIILM